MENQKTEVKENLKYLMLSRRQLLKLWKYANKKSINEYGKKVLCQTITLRIKEETTHKNQMNIYGVDDKKCCITLYDL